MNAFDIKAGEVWACNCVGPQNGEPKCPCAMRNVFIRDGRYIQREVDLGPAPSAKTNFLSRWRKEMRDAF